MAEAGFCECGCGQRTKLASKTSRRHGWVKGQPLRFIHGHSGSRAGLMAGGWNRIEGDGPNPSGLCQCGCGRRTTIAARSGQGQVAGTSIRFIPGHQNRKRLVAADWIVDPDGCWIWQGPPGSHGRGQINRAGVVTVAYRWVYEQLRGPIPTDHHLHHLCGNPLCVNPDHLEPMTPSAHSRLHAATA